MNKDQTKEEIKRIITDEDIRFVKLQFTDMYGMPKNVNIPFEKIDEALSGREVFDGSAVEGFIRNDEEDMLLLPDIDTFNIYPFAGRGGNTASFICDIMNAEGKPFDGDPRFILKHVLEELSEKEYTFKIRPELEFFLFNCNEEGHPTTNNPEVASYFDMAPLDFGENLRDEMVMALEEMGYSVLSAHHETSNGQHEIDLDELDVLKCADAIAMAKILIKIIARRNGMHATFMPKPKSGSNGSGLHLNMGLFDKNGKNLFEDSNDKYGLSEMAYSFMAGVMNHVAGMSLILNPLVNSYKRIVPGFDAPVDVSWSSGTNRGSFLRIPSGNDDIRIELRNPDPSCNAYLGLALVLAAGMEGIKLGLKPQKEGESVGKLFENLGDAIEAYENDEFIKKILGDNVYNKYLAAKKHEWKEYILQVTPWEIGEYLLKY